MQVARDSQAVGEMLGLLVVLDSRAAKVLSDLLVVKVSQVARDLLAAKVLSDLPAVKDTRAARDIQEVRDSSAARVS